nr:glutaminase [uncultured Desulfobacter sp.]
METNHKYRSIKIITSLIAIITVIFFLDVGTFAFQKNNFIDTKTATQDLQQLVNDTYKQFKDVKDGKNADYIPFLATVPSELFGIAIALRDGTTYSAGDADYLFAIESVSKPFTAALVMQQYNGPGVIVEKIGVEPTGLAFNSKLAIELIKERSVNPLVNAGAIAAVSLVKAGDETERWSLILNNMSKFAGTTLKMMDEVFRSEYSTSWSNRSIANNLYNSHGLTRVFTVVQPTTKVERSVQVTQTFL